MAMTAPTKGTEDPQMHGYAGPEGALLGGDSRSGKGARSRQARAPRRKMSLGRGGVLVVDGRTHIVGLADVSVTGAYLTTGAPVVPGETCVLKLAPVKGRVQLALRVRVVRVAQSGEELAHHPRGVAVQFLEIGPDTLDLLESFVGRGPDLLP
jgi:hypothetical protein